MAPSKQSKKRFVFSVMRKDGLGSTEEFSVVAEDREQAKTIAIEEWYVIISRDEDISEVWDIWTTKPFFYKKKLSDEQVWFFMLNMGSFEWVTTVKALEILSMGASKYNVRDFYTDLVNAVRWGNTMFSFINLSEWKKSFRADRLELIKIAEATSSINKVFSDVAQEMEDSKEIAAKLRQIAIYPSFLIIAIVGCFYILLSMILPRIIEMTGRPVDQLPPLTQGLVKIGDVFTAFGPYVFFGVIILIIGISFWKKNDGFKAAYDKFLLNIPLIGSFIQLFSQINIARGMSICLDSGILPKQTIQMISTSMSNRTYEDKLKLIAENIEKWSRLGIEFSDPSLFNPDFTGMIRVGEEASKIPQFMVLYYKRSRREFSNLIDTLSKVVEFSSLLIIGFWVLLFVLGVYQGIMTITESFSSSM